MTKSLVRFIGAAGLLATAAQAHAWTPPIGVPMPPFGVNEVAGGFTHFVNVSHPLATDTNNPFGTPTLPRRTVPTSALPAGSVVEVHGGPYTVTFPRWRGTGTQAAPIFIKGVGSPIFTSNQGEVTIDGSYIIVEGLIFERTQLELEVASHHVSVRFNEIRNWPNNGPTGMLALPNVRDVVVYGNHIHDCGDINSTEELDIVGVAVGDGTQRAWVVDNHIHHIAGDSSRVGGNNLGPEGLTSFIYIARNQFHDNQENGLDVKVSADVIVSQNLMYNFKIPASGSDSGTALVVHYDPPRIWILHNAIHSAVNGIRCTGASDGFYVIGNLLWNIKHEPGQAYDPSSLYGPHAIKAYATPQFYAVNNTIYGSDAGISYPTGNGGEFVNNVVAGLTAVSHHVAMGSSTGNRILNNVFDAVARIRFGSSTVRDCAQSQAAFPSQIQNCLNTNPQFVNPTASDFHLLPSSAAVNNGVTNHSSFARFQSLYGLNIAFDLDGIGRPVGPAFDLGSYELQPLVSATDASKNEGHFGNSTHGVTLSLNGATPQTVLVNYTVTAGTATAGVDFVAGSGTVAIPPYVTSQPLPVTVIGDLTDENNETYQVTITGVTGAQLGDAQAVGTILDDDPAPEVFIEDCSVLEGNAGGSGCSFRLGLTAASSFPVSVSYQTVPGSASSGTDFVPVSGTLSFSPGSFAPQSVSVTVNGDTAVEVDEVFGLSVSNPQNATTPDPQGDGLIRDDDAAPLSTNELFHGSNERGDLAAAPTADADLYRLMQRARSSYEVVVDEVSGDIAPDLVLERLAADNVTVLQTGQPLGTGSGVVMRWQNTSAGDLALQHIVVRSEGCTTACGSDDTYRIRVYETTYSAARFNNTGGQVTVVFLQNPSDRPVNGTIWFWGSSGALLYARTFTIAPRSLFTLNSLTVAPLLGQAGSMTISHDAPYGGLIAKAAMIDPVGGYAFDATVNPLPR